MSNIRRYFLPNTAVFITAVCHERQPHLAAAERKELLLDVMREVNQTHSFRMSGFVILDDHFHWLFEPTLPDRVPQIIQAVKLRFARRLKRAVDGMPAKIWQRRYWDHLIRDQNDLQRHLDYIHYNPVKHGLVTEPGKYPWSSFRQYLLRGSYARDWGTVLPPENIKGLHSE